MTAATEGTRDAGIQTDPIPDLTLMGSREDDTTVLAVSAMTGEKAATILQHRRMHPQRTVMRRQPRRNPKAGIGTETVTAHPIVTEIAIEGLDRHIPARIQTAR